MQHEFVTALHCGCLCHSCAVALSLSLFDARGSRVLLVCVRVCVSYRIFGVT